VLGDGLRAFRIGDGAGDFPVFSGEGARRFPGRWNSGGQAMIYACEHYSTAMLEKLVRLGQMPPRQHFVAIAIPAGVSYEIVTRDSLPGWYESGSRTARAFGSTWLAGMRSAILIVPSVVARMERNVLINPSHTDFSRIKTGLEQPIWWDERLFAQE